MTGSKQHGSISKPNSADADLIVIGGGSAGFAAAIRVHELGAKGILINTGVIGGTSWRTASPQSWKEFFPKRKRADANAQRKTPKVGDALPTSARWWTRQLNAMELGS